MAVMKCQMPHSWANLACKFPRYDVGILREEDFNKAPYGANFFCV